MSILALSKYEKDHCLTGSFPSEDSLDAQFYIAQIREGNARKCEALALSEPVAPLLKIRAFLMRGKLQEAELSLLAAQKTSTEPLGVTELLLEEARLANSQANWSIAIEKCSEALTLGPSPVSTLTLLQIRALAYFEKNELLSSLRDLESAESLASIFLRSSAGFYAQVLEAKVRARTQKLSTGRNMLDSLWASEQLNVDLILTLLRAEIDLRRLSGEAILDYAIATKSLSRFIGDQLYEALAWVDIYYALPPEQRIFHVGEIQHFRKTYTRIDRLCNEVDTSPDFISGTALAIQSSVVQIISTKTLDCDFLILPNRKIFNVKSGSCVEVETGRIGDALSFLAHHSSTSKAKFFSAIWGSQKYVPRLHDNLIWNTLSRIRKAFQVDVIAKNGQIIMESKVLDLQC